MRVALVSARPHEKPPGIPVATDLLDLIQELEERVANLWENEACEVCSSLGDELGEFERHLRGPSLAFPPHPLLRALCLESKAF